MYAHRIIWETVYGPIPAGHYIDHKNGRKGDNRIRNLEPVVPTENSRRAIRKGLVRTGEQQVGAKLTAVQVCEIRRTESTISGAEWARELGLDRTTVNSARRRQTWRHIVCHRDGTASVRHTGRVAVNRRPRRRKSKPGRTG
ncbi:HNH endonuclease signature motif containing protein [Pseudomonas sp. CGJS7]|uniref:HNH endonuclease signature motif containing protein n=1 Tax=Pseudomonas sp. CGJS7 TaxID=3109348 RepID=UPI003FA740A8